MNMFSFGLHTLWFYVIRLLVSCTKCHVLLCVHCHSHVRSGIQKVISVYSQEHQVLAKLP